MQTPVAGAGEREFEFATRVRFQEEIGGWLGGVEMAMADPDLRMGEGGAMGIDANPQCAVCVECFRGERDDFGGQSQRTRQQREGTIGAGEGGFAEFGVPFAARFAGLAGDFALGDDGE